MHLSETVLVVRSARTRDCKLLFHEAKHTYIFCCSRTHAHCASFGARTQTHTRRNCFGLDATRTFDKPNNMECD